MRLGKSRKKKPTYCGRHGHGHGSRHAKIRYRTLKDAKGARSAMEHGLGIEVRIYGCKTCGGYHLTTQPEYAHGNTRTVWKSPDREISSEEGVSSTEEEQDERS